MMAGIKTRHSSFLVPVILIAGAVVLSGSSSVFAGFEWKGATPQSPAAPMPRPAQAESALPEMPVQKIQPVEAVPVDVAPIALAPLPVVPSPEASGSEVISGFGSDLPLAIALKQVVPERYPSSLEAGVSPDILVSWEGGHPWQQVLATMLSSRSLGFRLQNNIVTVGRFEGKEKPAASAAVTPVMKQTPPPAGKDKVDMIPIDMIAAVKESAAPAVSPPGQPQPLTAIPQQAAAPAAMVPETVVTDNSPEVSPARSPAAVFGSTWMAHKGRTLREVLADWAKMEDIEVFWSIDYDYRLRESSAYSGTFEDAVASLLGQFDIVRPQPYGQLHVGSAGPRVLVVSSYDLPH